LKKSIETAKELEMIKGGSKILFMQEEGTDISSSRLGTSGPSASHSYKKIVEIPE